MTLSGLSMVSMAVMSRAGVLATSAMLRYSTTRYTLVRGHLVVVVHYARYETMSLPVMMTSIVLFGPQGSESLFSERAVNQALEDVSSSPVASALLSRCHAAFVQDLLCVGLEKPFGPDTILPGTPHALLAFPAVITTHPIIEVSRLCLYQLLRYAGRIPLSSSRINDDFACGGFSSGIIPAAAAAASNTVDEYLAHGVAAFRLSFWIGYRNWQWCRRVEAGWSGEVAPRSLMVRCEQGNGQLQDTLTSKFSRLSLAGVSDNGWVTISGPSKDLNDLKELCSNDWRLPTRSLHIHGVYHAGSALRELVDVVCGDMSTQNIDFPQFEDLKRPLMSPSDGKYLESASTDAKNLLELILDFLLVDSFDWNSVSESIAARVNAALERDRGVKVLLTSVGPSSGILCSGVKKLVMAAPDDFIIDDLWFTQEPSGSASASVSDGDIAIIGMAVDMPGAPTVEEFWNLMLHGQNTVQEIPKSRFDAHPFLRQAGDDLELTRRLDTQYGNFLDDIWGLDNAFYGVSRREAKSMDPQQKVLLRVVKAALEDAGYVADSTPGFQRDTLGCYVGAATGDYPDNLKHDIDVYYSPGTLRAFLSGKISYQYKLTGPSIVVDTACSSSTVALYQACRALQNGDCTAALAGGVNTISSPDVSQMYMGLNRGHFLSSSGQCKPFDANADGYCRAEGCGMFVLKRLSVAIAENDRVLGVIKGIEVNQSGKSQSITHPDSGTQASLLMRLLSKAGVTARTIGVIEAHGTGTQAGDNGEVRSLHKVFAEHKSRKPVLVSSIKGNIGHCEAASGSAGLAKLLLMLRYGEVPMQASLKTINPSLAKFLTGPLVVPRETTTWLRASGEPRRAVLNNFGAAGSNAALILEEFVHPQRDVAGKSLRSAFPFLISARSAEAATQWQNTYQLKLSEQDHDFRIEDICYTATARRQIYEYTFATSCSSTNDLLSQIQGHKIRPGKIGSTNQNMVFVFSGQGSSYMGMGKELILTSPLYRRTVFQCDEILRRYGVPGVVDFLTGTAAPSPSATSTEQAILSQCATIVLQYALCKLWQSWNVMPSCVVGHSIGEYAALAIADVLSIEDSLCLAAHRARLMTQACESQTTGMLACRFSVSEAEDQLRQFGHDNGLEVVCRNSPKDCVVGGKLDQLSAFASHCSVASLETKQLAVPYAFHSAAMDPILESLGQLAQSVNFSDPTISVYSTVLGRRLTHSDLDSSYFARHTRQPVLFVDAIQQLEMEEPLKHATVIEIGPHPSVLPLVSASLSSSDWKLMYSLRKDTEPWVSLSDTLCKLAPVLNGINWRSVFDGTDAQLIDLPGHPLFPVPSGVEYVEEKSPRLVIEKELSPTRFLFGLRKISSEQENINIIETHLSSIGKFITGHNVGGTPICPASVSVELVLQAAHLTGDVGLNEIWTVKDMTFAKPLIYRGTIDDRTSIHVVLERRNAAASTFKIEYAGDQSDKYETSAEGTIELVPTKSLGSMWLRQHAFVKRQRDHLTSGEMSRINYIQQSMLYEILFPRVVEYSSDYHSIQDLSMSATGDEGYGSVRFPKNSTEGDLISPPVVSDTLLHASGFIANAHAKSTDVYICNRIESLVVTYTKFDLSASYNIYCTLLQVSPDTIIADSFLLNSSDEIVAAAQGIHFRKVRLSGFRASLTRAGTPRESHTPRHLPTPNIKVDLDNMAGSTRYGTPRTPESPISSGLESPDTEAVLLKLVASTCGISDAQLNPDQSLGDLGIDSMMLLELSTAIEKNGLGKLSSGNLGPATTLKTMLGSVHNHFHKLDEKALHTVDSAVSLTEPQSRRAFKPGKKSTTEVLASICGADVGSLRSDTTLESIGVDSMMRIELQEAIERQLGASVSMDQLLACVNVGELERICAASSAPSSSEVEVPLVTSKPTLLRPGRSDKVPCYLFHDGSGYCSMYQRLGDVDRNLWGFASSSSSAESLVDMAKAYVDSIESSGDNEVCLGGWSFGGVLALEAAQQLIKKGYKVKGLVLIDSPCPDDHIALPTPLIDHILDSAAFASVSSANKQVLSSRFRHHAQLLEAYQPPRSKLESLKVVLLQSREIIDTMNRCGVDYPWLSSKESHMASSKRWQQFFKQEIVIHDIPGNHFEPFMESNLPSVSKCFREALNYIDG